MGCVQPLFAKRWLKCLRRPLALSGCLDLPDLVTPGTGDETPLGLFRGVGS